MWQSGVEDLFANDEKGDAMHPTYLTEVTFVIPISSPLHLNALYSIVGVREVVLMQQGTVKVWYRITPSSPELLEIENQLCRLLER